MDLVSLEEELEQKSHQLMDKQKQAVLDQTEARRAEKVFLETANHTPLSRGLDDRATTLISRSGASTGKYEV